MSNKIIFGNNVGYKINNYLLKKQIINYLESNVDIFKLCDNIIIEEENLLTIKNESYVAIPNIVGEDYIFIAVKLQDIFYVILIEKKTLQNMKNINYNELNMISIRIRLSIDVYKGTIFDGRIVNLGGCSAFIINKIYKINGDDMSHNTIHETYKLAENFIDESYIIDSNMNSILFKLNKIYELNDFDKLVNEKIPNSKFKFSSIDFIASDISKTFRHYYTNQDYDIKQAVMFGKLISTDVIELFSTDENNKIKRVGIAHIPDIKTSIICNNHISESELSLLKCKLDYRFKKWVPQEINLESIEVTEYNEIINMMMNIISH
jgi:hypothetical protein